MNKAFIFDLDGVLIKSDGVWEIEKHKLYQTVFEPHIASNMQSTVGLSMEAIYQRAKDLGTKTTWEEAQRAFSDFGPHIYHTAQLSEGTKELIRELKTLHYKIGLVSASPIAWIEIVLERLQNKEDFDLVISLHTRKDLKQKPSPDGYNHTIAELGATPETTLILEDSNTGIRAAKGSGATVIGFKQNLVEGYKQEGADVYADTIEDVIKTVRSFKG